MNFEIILIKKIDKLTKMDNMDMSNPRTSPYAPIMTGQVTSPRVLDDVDKIGLARVPTPFISKANQSDIIP